MEEHRIVEGWRDFDMDAVPDEHRSEFLTRRRAIEMLLIDRKRYDSIRRETGVSAKLLKALVDKAEALASDGYPRGYEALIPYTIVDYVRSAPENVNALYGKGKAGLFSKLMEDHPENLKEWLEDLFLFGLKGPNGKRKRVKRREIHGLFLIRCAELHIPLTHYPFSSASKGKRSLYRYLLGIEARRQANIVGASAGSDVATAFSSDAAGRPRNKPTRLFERFQLDGHRIDAAASVEIPTASGMPLRIPLFDVWMVDLVCRLSTITFGHSLCLSGNYNRYDMQRCLASAVGMRQAHEGIQDFLPVHFVPEIAWMAFDDIELDRALAHQANEVIEVLHDTFNARVRFGEAHKPRKRPQVEYVYQELESRGIARLPSSLRPDDGIASRERAMKLALEHCISVHDLEEIIRRAHLKRLEESRIKYEGRSQLEYLKWYVASHAQSVRKVPSELQRRQSVMRLVHEAKVVGDPNSGRRPHINWLYGDYRGDIVSRSRLYLGRRVKLIGDPDDVRRFNAYIDGTFIDTVFVQSPWAMRPHSIETRRRAAGFFREANVNVKNLHDAISDYEREILARGAKASITSKETKEIARIQREAISHELREQLPEEKPSSAGPAVNDSTIRPGRKAINF
jgi:putative transposase